MPTDYNGAHLWIRFDNGFVNLRQGSFSLFTWNRNTFLFLSVDFFFPSERCVNGSLMVTVHIFFSLFALKSASKSLQFTHTFDTVWWINLRWCWDLFTKVICDGIGFYANSSLADSFRCNSLSWPLSFTQHIESWFKKKNIKNCIIAVIVTFIKWMIIAYASLSVYKKVNDCMW